MELKSGYRPSTVESQSYREGVAKGRDVFKFSPIIAASSDPALPRDACFATCAVKICATVAAYPSSRLDSPVASTSKGGSWVGRLMSLQCIRNAWFDRQRAHRFGPIKQPLILGVPPARPLHYPSRAGEGVHERGP